MSEKAVRDSQGGGSLRSPYADDNQPTSPYLVPANHQASGKDISTYPVDDFFHAEHVGHTFTALIGNGQSIKEPVEHKPNRYKNLGCLSYMEPVDSNTLQQESQQQWDVHSRRGSMESESRISKKNAKHTNGRMLHVTSSQASRDNGWESTQESHLTNPVAPCLTHVDPQTSYIYTSQSTLLSNAGDWKVTESSMETFTKACSLERLRTNFTIKNLKMIQHGMLDVSLETQDKEGARSSIPVEKSAGVQKTEELMELEEHPASSNGSPTSSALPSPTQEKLTAPDQALGGMVYKFESKSDDYVSAVLSQPYIPPPSSKHDKSMLPVGRAAGIPGSVQALQSYTNMLSTGQTDYAQFRVMLLSKQLTKELQDVDSLLQTLHVQLPTDMKLALKDRMSEVCGVALSHDDFVAYLRYLNNCVKQLDYDKLEVDKNIGSDFVPVLQSYQLHQLKEANPAQVDALIQNRLQRILKGTENDGDRVLIDWSVADEQDGSRLVQNSSAQSIFRQAVLDWQEMRKLYHENKSKIEQWEANMPLKSYKNQIAACHYPSHIMDGEKLPLRPSMVSTASVGSMNTAAVLNIYGAKPPKEKAAPIVVKPVREVKPRKLDDINKKANTSKSTSQSGETRVLEARRAALVKKYKAVTGRILALPFSPLPGTLPLHLHPGGETSMLEGPLEVDLSLGWMSEMNNPVDMPPVFTISDLMSTVYGNQSQKILHLNVDAMDTTIKPSKKTNATIPAYQLPSPPKSARVVPSAQNSDAQLYNSYLETIQTDNKAQTDIQVLDKSEKGMAIGDISFYPPQSEKQAKQRMQRAAQNIPDTVFNGRVMDTVPQKHYKLPYGGLVTQNNGNAASIKQISMPLVGATAQQLDYNSEKRGASLHDYCNEDYSDMRGVKNVVRNSYTPIFPFEAPLITPNKILMKIHEVDQELKAITDAAAGVQPPSHPYIAKQLVAPPNLHVLPGHDNTLRALPSARLRKAGLSVLQE